MGAGDRFLDLLHSIGFFVVWKSSRNVKLLLAQRFFRLFAYGTTFLLLVQFLALIGVSEKRAGAFMTLTLLGDAVISFVLVLITDRIGRRKILGLGAIFMIASGVVFATSKSYALLLVTGILGVISPSGNEIGPFRAVEESILSDLTDKEDRTDVFAWYNLCGTAGAAIGTITSGWLVHILTSIFSVSELHAYRTIFVLYTALSAAKFLLVWMLSPHVEIQHVKGEYQPMTQLEHEDQDSDTSSLRHSEDGEHAHATTKVPQEEHEPPTLRSRFLPHAMNALLPQIPSKSLRILLRLSVLFFMDSFASGLASPSWLTFFFTTYHKVEPGILGSLFFTTNILATLSNFAAVPLARRIGPIKTMAFTHLPSAILLGMIPFPPPGMPGTFVSVALLFLRACTQSMDQAPRQTFLAAVIRPEERTATLGVINIVKTIAQAGGLGTAGLLVAPRFWRLLFGSAGALKVSYDLLILWTFLHLKLEN